MDKEKVKEILREVIRNNIDSLEFDNDRHNAPLRKANGLLHDALIELDKSDWVSVEDKLPPYDKEVEVCNEYVPNEIWYSRRVNDRYTKTDSYRFIKFPNRHPVTHWRRKKSWIE